MRVIWIVGKANLNLQPQKKSTTLFEVLELSNMFLAFEKYKKTFKK